jgi:hypothetical protein
MCKIPHVVQANDQSRVMSQTRLFAQIVAYEFF